MMWRHTLAVTVLVVLLVSLTHGFWTPSIGRSLVCTEEAASSDTILVENFDPDYQLFERAASLQRARPSARVLVPVQPSGPDSGRANPVSKGIAELMAHFARVQNLDIITMDEMEPFTLNTAYRIRDFLTKEHRRSVVVVASAFRSRRSLLAYRAVLSPAGVLVHCLPVFGAHTPDNWTATWHGIQVVSEQFLKLQVYRFYVLRRQWRSGCRRTPSGVGRSSRGRSGGDRVHLGAAVRRLAHVVQDLCNAVHMLDRGLPGSTSPGPP
jgi:hypothetical protein